jgi:hypothetical protein
MGAGYEDTGGREYPSEKEDLLKSTMILEYSKDIRLKLYENENENFLNFDESVTLSPIENMLNEIDDLTNLSFENVTWNNVEINPNNPITRAEYPGSDIEPGIVSTGEESMEGLMSQLFSALHSERK